MADPMNERVAQALRAACRDEFGTDWNNDVARKFARVAIEAMRRPTAEMWEAWSHERDPWGAYEAMILEALKDG